MQKRSAHDGFSNTSDISMFCTNFLYQNDNKEESRANNICLISVSFQTFENSSKKIDKNEAKFSVAR